MIYTYLSYSLRVFFVIFILFLLVKNWKKKNYIIYIYIFTVPFEISIKVLNFTMSISDIIGIIIIIFFFIDIMISDRYKFDSNLIMVVILYIFSVLFSFLYTTISKNFSRNVIQSSKIIIQLFTMMYFYQVLIDGGRKIIYKSVSILEKSIFINSFIAIIMFILSFILRNDILPTARNFSIFSPSGIYQSMPLVGTPFFRAHSFGEPKSIAAWASLGIIISLFKYKNRKNNFMLFIFILAVLLSFSRSGIIESLLIFITYILFNIFIEKKIKISQILLIGLIFIIFFVYILQSSNYQQGIINKFSEINNTSELLEEYDYAIYINYKENPSFPVLPKGIAYTQEIARKYLPSYAYWSIESDFTVRRGFILMLVEFGYIGTFILFFISFFSFIKLYKKKEYSFFLFFLTWSIFYFVEVSHSLIGIHRLIFIMFIALISIIKKEERSHIFE